MTPRETLIAYLLMKVHEGDFHAVCDAACDIREMDAEKRGETRQLFVDTTGAVVKLPKEAICSHPYTAYSARLDATVCTECGETIRTRVEAANAK